MQHFLDDYFRANPTFAVFQGKHEYDGQFPDWSVAGVQAEIARLHREQARASAFEAAKLDPRRRFQREYLLAVVDRDLFWLEVARFPWTNPAFYGDSLDPNVYVARPYAPLPVRMKALTAWANGAPAALAQIRATLQTPMPLPLAEIGKIRFGGLATYLENDVPQAFAAVTDPAAARGVRQRPHARRRRVPRHGRLVRHAESQRRRQLRARARALSEDAVDDRAGEPDRRPGRGDRARRSRAQPQGAGAGVRALRAGKEPARVHGEDERAQEPRRAASTPRARSSPA